MTDLPKVLPGFDLRPYSHLMYSLDKKGYTIVDLITLESVDIARECPLPLKELKKLVTAVSEALQQDMSTAIRRERSSIKSGGIATGKRKCSVEETTRTKLVEPEIVKTLDATLDETLGGGFHTGYITEIAGESSAGKTQLVLGLLLATQLAAPHGLGRSSVYISTESSLNTTRLHQILASHPVYTTLPESERPNLDRIYSIAVSDIEAQDHIIEFQLPVAVKRYNVGLVVVDSVAANYRAEYDTKTARGLGERAVDLTRLGKMLRTIAVDFNVAVVVTNQVADRFDDPSSKTTQELLLQSSTNASSSPATQAAIRCKTPQGMVRLSRRDEKMLLDHQQRFFTGWGNEPAGRAEAQKTPALGMAWANQIAARVVLKIEDGNKHSIDAVQQEGKRRRSLSVVFAPWAASSKDPVPYEIHLQGLVSIRRLTSAGAGVYRQGSTYQAVSANVEEDLFAKDPSLLDPATWLVDGNDEDDEFPF